MRTAQNVFFNKVAVKVDDELNFKGNSKVNLEIKKNLERYLNNDLGFKICENSSLEDYKNSLLTNRNIQRTDVGAYMMKINKVDYVMFIYDNPKCYKGVPYVSIKNFDKI